MCRELISRRGWSLDKADIYRDNETSATKAKPRKGYRAMLARVESGDVDTIVCVDLDRLLRQPLELEHLITLADTTGLWAVSTAGDLDLSTEDGQLHARIRVAVARDEVARKGRRQHRAELRAVEMGRPPRRRAFGYVKGGMDLEPAEAAAVADAYRMLLAGSSLGTIARRINDRGLTTTLGRPWEPTAVRTLLLNARNAAIRTYYGEEAGPGTWPAIVPEDVYRQAVALLRDPARTTSGGSTARKHLGAGLYLCGVCAANGVESTVRTAYRGAAAGVSRGGTGRIYVCQGPSKHLARLADPVDELVTGVVEARLARPDLADLLTVDDPELAGLHEKAAAIRARIRRIEADYGDGDISARVMREQIDRQTAELTGIERRVAALTRSSRLAAVVGSGDPVAAWRGLDVPARQAVVKALMDITLLRGRPGRGAFDPESVRFDWKCDDGH